MIDRNIKEFGKEWAEEGTEAHEKWKHKYGEEHMFIPPKEFSGPHYRRGKPIPTKVKDDWDNPNYDQSIGEEPNP
jgi:hypothetical protein